AEIAARVPRGSVLGVDPSRDMIAFASDHFGPPLRANLRFELADVHFRSVSAPLPHFVETFPDDGYLDMYRVMRELRGVGFDGAMEPDHVPQLVGDKGIRPAGTAYCVASMRFYLRRANEEVGG